MTKTKKAKEVAEYYAEAFGIGGKATKKEIKKIILEGKKMNKTKKERENFFAKEILVKRWEYFLAMFCFLVIGMLSMSLPVQSEQTQEEDSSVLDKTCVCGDAIESYLDDLKANGYVILSPEEQYCPEKYDIEFCNAVRKSFNDCSLKLDSCDTALDAFVEQVGFDSDKFIAKDYCEYYMWGMK